MVQDWCKILGKCGTANGNRTRILALKGLRANRCTIAALGKESTLLEYGIWREWTSHTALTLREKRHLRWLAFQTMMSKSGRTSHLDGSLQKPYCLVFSSRSDIEQQSKFWRCRPVGLCPCHPARVFLFKRKRSALATAHRCN